MTGRGIDQILAHPSDPVLYELSADSAEDYVELAERRHGPIARAVAPDYIWGDALAAIEARAPDARIVNLETAVTTCPEAEPKGINYRMHPDNVGCLVAGGIDCCGLANNHVLDWGVGGLLETIATLRQAGIATTGAGSTFSEAHQPAILRRPNGGRVLVQALGCPTSGIPQSWKADRGPGIAVLEDLSPREAARLGAAQARTRRPGDTVVMSLHWGGNWGYAIPQIHRAFARALIDSGAVDLVHGHSSHHARAIEVYRGKLILYGCGDFITDYEGIADHEQYRPDIAVAYFATLDSTSGRLVGLEMALFRSRRFRLERAPPEDIDWLGAVLTREGDRLGTGAVRTPAGTLALRW